MRLTARHHFLGLLALSLTCCIQAAPIPVPEDAKLNSIEAYEDGLLIFVPTVSAKDKDKSGHNLKREIEYELIAIPGEVLRREIRQIAQTYGAPAVSDDTTFIIGPGDIQDFGEVIIPSPPSAKPTISLPSKPAISLPPITLPTLQVSNKPDFGAVVSAAAGNAASIAGSANDFIGNAGQTIAQVGSAGTQVLGQVGTAAASGGLQLASWLAQQKGQGLRTATQVVGGGLQYAGQLSAGVLRALLQVPGIKARVLSEVLEAGQPLVYAVSDVLAESSDDLATLFEAKTSILQEAMGIIIRLIQDTLALKGRVIHSFSSSGLDIGATAFNAGVRIGGAAVESATGIAGALGRGFSDIISAGSSVNLPAPPSLPPITLPSLPNINVPPISIPNVDLSGLIPSKPALTPIPLPQAPTVSLSVSGGGGGGGGGLGFSAPSQTYGTPGR